ncbi:hypothetical protein N7510_004187 [Penicillium lagena]|uniref:uncharacterized protein n=1 Tax=Penicillium lagena TaxID=94218 RepID=UPI00254255B6|nr:uncharacterized protein N7510_004187 [Penicillium lagena]KAJ5620203.1 hypothetical protein N7510_004187 [Penicillium lagena]
MAKVIFTAWKHKSQLIEVRNQFYPSPSYDGPDLRSRACATVAAWKLRGNIPHHVEATALLTDAILHDDAQRNSIFSIRATYSAAFCRFVTGLVDSKIPGQRRTMFQRAVDLGLPASFVELRHEATHREPPSLVVLRKATQRSLEWLWDNYWAGIDEFGEAPPLDSDDIASVKKALRDTLLPISGGSNATAEPLSKKRKRDQDLITAAQLVSICNVSGTGVRVLPSVLLDESILIPAGRKLGESLHDTFAKWDTVLRTVTESDPSFMMYLTEALVDDLAFNEAKDTSSNAHAEVLFLWLDHVSSSPFWISYRRMYPRSYVLRACEESSGHWAKMLSAKLQETKEESNAVSVHGQKLANPAQNGHSDAAPFAELRQHGWGLLDKWDSRPLGMA